MHDHEHNPASPWEERFLPEGAVSELHIRVFFYDNESIEDVMAERIESAVSCIRINKSGIQGAQTENEPVAMRVGIENETERTEHEWFFEPIQK